MKIAPISETPSVAVAVIADEENVIPTKNDFDDASREDDEDVDVDERSSSSSRWTKCFIASLTAGVLVLVAVVAVLAALPLIYTRETESGDLQITHSMNQSGEFTRLIKSITSNGQHGTCSIDERGYSITYTPNEGFFGIDTCTYTVVVCTDTDGCDDSTKETLTFYVEDPDAPIAAPDVMVLVSEETTESTTTSPSLPFTARTSAVADNPCSECSITNDTNNFCGQLGIYPFQDACASQTECTERGLECIGCTSVDGYDGIVGEGAYICVEEEGSETVDDTTTTTTTENPCSECSITNGKNNFCGQLGIYPFQDACASQTECTERGLECMGCTSVDGFDGVVGEGVYICVEEEGGNKAADDTTNTTTTTLPTTISSPTTNTMAASLGAFESLSGTQWQAAKIMWRLDSSTPEELKETTEEDRNPITLVFKSDYRVGGTCGNNSCSSSVSLRDNQVLFGKFRRTRMAASEQEQNYVFLLQENMFYYDVVENSDGSLELHLNEIVVEDGVERRGRLMATYVQLSSEEEV